jgi:hypothetical protein
MNKSDNNPIEISPQNGFSTANKVTAICFVVWVGIAVIATLTIHLIVISIPNTDPVYGKAFVAMRYLELLEWILFGTTALPALASFAFGLYSILTSIKNWTVLFSPFLHCVGQ